MGIEGIKTIGYPAAYKTGAQKKSPASTDFEQQKSHTVNNPKKRDGKKGKKAHR